MIYAVDGLEIQTSNTGRSGYNAVTFSPVWTQDPETPFIAEKRNPVDDYVLSQYLLQPNSDSVKLGYYKDAREAAYVVAMYNQDPEGILKELYETGEISVQFPKELYDLPVFLSHDEAKDMMINERIKRKAAKKTVKLADALAIARDHLKGKKVKNVAQIRKEIENNIKKKVYSSKDDIIENINSIAKMG